MKKKLKIIYIGILILIILSLILFYGPKISSNAVKSNSNNIPSKPIIVTKENFPSYLEGNSMIKSMPKKGSVLLHFYKFENGNREISQTYSVVGNDVSNGNNLVDESDLEIYIDEKYISEMGKGFCSALKKANNNGELEIELKKSEGEILFKYRGLLKYKDCLS